MESSNQKNDTKPAFFDVFYYTNFYMTITMLTLELLFNLTVAYVNRKGSKFKFVDNVIWLFIASNLLAFPMYLSMYFVIKADDSHHDHGKCDCDFIDGWITI